MAKNRFNAYRWAADQGREVTGTLYLENGMVKTTPGVLNDPCTPGDACIATSETFGDYHGNPANIIGEWHTHPKGWENHLSKGDIANTPSLNHYPNYQYSFLGAPNGEAYAMDHTVMLKLQPSALGGTLTNEMIQSKDRDLGKY